MNRQRFTALAVSAAIVFWACGIAEAAIVNADTGYTNDFSSQPAAADWATTSIAGGATDSYAMPSDVNANITASGTTSQTTAKSGTPAMAALATWSSTGFLQTRPTLNRYTALMGKFVNATGTNATEINIRYTMTFGGSAVAEDGGLGTQVFYSLTGTLNSWTNIAALNTTANTGTSNQNASVSLPWPDQGTLFLLWVDDNASAGADTGDQIDSFSLQVTAGSPVFTGPSCVLNAPAHGGSFSAPAAVIFSAIANPGEGATITGVGFYEVTAGLLGSASTSPYTNGITLDAGTYGFFAVATNSLEAVLYSGTNNVTVTNAPLAVVVSAPTNGQTYLESQSVSASATVSGGAAPYAYAVTFYTNRVGGSVGPVAASGSFPSFTASLGTLPSSSYQVYAEATDGSASIRSATNTFSTVGPIHVPAAGVTLGFSSLPPVQQWSTYSVPGSVFAARSLADLDAEMATNTAANISTVLPSQAGSGTSGNAYWRSGDQKLGTQPSQNRQTLLMATLVNDAPIPISRLDVAYTFGLASVTPGEVNAGHRVYWSATGLANSWTPLGFTALTSPGSISTNFSVIGLEWEPGTRLYLVWLDDNGTSNPDGDYTMDDITFTPTLAVLNVAVTAPANGQLHVSGTDVVATAAVASGTAPYVVRFRMNRGLGNPDFAPAGEPLTNAPFTLHLGPLTAGTFNLYAEVTDEAGGGTTARSATNTFLVADPLSIVLTDPLNGRSFDWAVHVGASSVVAGGTPPYTVRFYTNSILAGTADSIIGTAYFRDLGNFFMGDHTVHAVVTDGKGWQSTSAVHTITITGPLFVTLAPTNSAAYNFGQAVTLTGTVVGGAGPYAVAFYTNGELANLTAPGLSPFTLDLGLLPVGAYTNFLLAIDHVGDWAYSTTNTLTIRPNPLSVAVTAPTNGQLFRASQTVTLGATASVGAPLSITNVEFFVDDALAGSDNAPPYTASVNGLADGSHLLYAQATDNLGRQSVSAPISFEILNLPDGIIVSASGYTASFDTQPPASEWSTWSFGSTGTGGSGEIASTEALDAAVQIISASLITAQCASASGSPPSAASTAVWASSGYYLQTRPTQNAATLLMATLVNNTRTNATIIRIAYDYTTNRAGLLAEEVRGHRVFYSLTGAANSWVNIAELSQTPQGLLSAEVALVGWWANGTAMYLLWADDNGSGAGDDANDIDSFSISVIAGSPPAASCALVTPASGQSFGAPASVLLTADANPGPEATVTGVGFYEVNAGFLGSVFTAPYTNLLELGIGTYQFYAISTNSLDVMTYSATNTITVTNVPVSVALASPANGQSYGGPASVSLAAAAHPGSGATLMGVGFYEVTLGFLGDALLAPYTNRVTLTAGTYQLYAVATNNLGTIVLSGTNSITVTNVPLSITLTTPVNGASYSPPATILCQATVNPGSSGVPIGSVAFYMASNGSTTLLSIDTAAPYSTEVTGVPDGSYSFHAVVTDELSAVAFSTTNAITVSSFVSGTVRRGPYLGSRGETNITVRWRTAESGVGRVRYGTSPDSLTAYADDGSSRTDHSVTLTGLSPETKYYYSIGTPAGTFRTGTNYHFSTAPPIGASRPTRLWMMTDYGIAGTVQDNVRDAYLNYIATNRRAADLWITGGDNEQSGFTGDDSTYQTTVFNVYSNILQNTPVFPCPGNHDGGSASAYWSIYDVPYQGQAGGMSSGSQHYYSYDYGNIHFISLDVFNTSISSGSPLLVWLTNDLASTTQPWIIAYFHSPVYCKAFYDSDTTSPLVTMRQNFAPLLERYGVDLVLSGHSHVHQRTYLLSQHYGNSTTFSPTNQVDAGDGRPDGTGAYLKPGGRGTVYCVAPTGCGGTRSGSTTHPACYLMINNTAGFVTIDVNSNRLDFKMITSAGAVGDYFTILKGASQSGPPAMPANLAATANGASARLAWSNNATNEVSYHLERSINGADFVEIATLGANLTSYTNTSLDFANAYYYRLRSWNNAGYSDYSAIVSLVPPGSLAIDRQPQSATNALGSTAEFYVLARGTAPISYQWFHRNSALDGQTNNLLRLANVSSGDAGPYTVVVSNGGTPLTSDAAILTVPGTVIAPMVWQHPFVTNGVFVVGFQGTPGTVYTLQSTVAFGAGWQNRTNVTTPQDGIILLQDDVRTLPQQFYRLVYPPEVH